MRYLSERGPNSAASQKLTEMGGYYEACCLITLYDASEHMTLRNRVYLGASSHFELP